MCHHRNVFTKRWEDGAVEGFKVGTQKAASVICLAGMTMVRSASVRLDLLSLYWVSKTLKLTRFGHFCSITKILNT